MKRRGCAQGMVPGTVPLALPSVGLPALLLYTGRLCRALKQYLTYNSKPALAPLQLCGPAREAGASGSDPRAVQQGDVLCVRLPGQPPLLARARGRQHWRVLTERASVRQVSVFIVVLVDACVCICVHACREPPNLGLWCDCCTYLRAGMRFAAIIDSAGM